ncbi:MAG: pilus (MSHA type) biogenesis protein MshL [Halofilum sp. (in: g-proteobacteria)]|nr:pilus (MSHA type) biogenesis protein MshL [Halofilum sp. (in: g-proteobacteria)]
MTIGSPVLIRSGLCALVFVLVAGCGVTRPPSPSEGHIEDDGGGQQADGAGATASDDTIPDPVTNGAPLPAPSEPEEAERYTVVVNQVPVRELLFALARDADLEIDIAGDIKGNVTLNAMDETLPRLLERISYQAAIRYELEDDYLRIAADDPYLESYPVDYVNLSRKASSTVETATQITSTGFGEDGGGGGSGGGSSGTNNSSTSLENESDNRFWETLERNLAGMLNVEVADSGDQAESSRYLMINREAGYITVRATQKQHEQVQRYIDKVMESARRQVLIEATVVEVELSDQYQAGVDWSYISSSVGGLDLLEQSLTAGSLGSAPNALATFVDTDLGGGELQATVRALETFGDVSVMSSPKIMALNNQLAILKVVDNRVYFTIDVEQTLDEGVTNTVFDSQINTVPVGLVMTVTPYIGADDEVLLNTRPTVSRILGFVEDPNPSLADAGVTNEVPEIQVREMESLLRVNSGQVAVIGGLMQDSIDQSERSVPLVGNLPLVGNFFSYRDDRVEKTELIIFLRPTVIDQANLDGDMKRFRQYLRTPAIESDSAGQP